MPQNVPPGFVRVPPGHEVRVYRPLPTAYLKHTESGIYLVDLGASATDALIFERVQQQLAQFQNIHVVWILQETYLDQLSDTTKLLHHFQHLLIQFGPSIMHAVVFPVRVPERFAFMQALNDLGVQVYFAAQDYACFVEVKRPQDVIGRMPGRQFLGRHAPLSELLHEYINTGAANSYQDFLDAFVGAPLGVTATQEQIGNASGLASSIDPQGRRVLLVFADPDAFQLRYGANFNAEVTGADVLQTLMANPDCHGIQINSAQAEVSLIIERIDAMKLLQQSATKETQASLKGTTAKTQKRWWQIW